MHVNEEIEPETLMATCPNLVNKSNTRFGPDTISAIGLGRPDPVPKSPEDIQHEIWAR
jgi:hypothetical protein